jgi:AbrB family looped-hinge helix DNA binding protein
LFYALAGEVIEVARVYRIGKSNGLALWIPSRVVKEIGLKPGDRLVIRVEDGRLTIVPLEKVVILDK